MVLDNLTGKQVRDLWENAKTLSEAAAQYCDDKENNLFKHPPNIFIKFDRELFEKITIKIQSSSLLVVGYQEPKTGHPFPDTLPQRIWPPDKINLSTSEIQVNEITYSMLRIIENPFSPEHLSKSDNPKPGRPSLKPLIIEAFEHLYKQGLIKEKKFSKSQTKLIQVKVMELHPDITKTKNMEYKTIDKILREYFLNR